MWRKNQPATQKPLRIVIPRLCQTYNIQRNTDTREDETSSCSSVNSDGEIDIHLDDEKNEEYPNLSGRQSGSNFAASKRPKQPLHPQKPSIFIIQIDYLSSHVITTIREHRE